MKSAEKRRFKQAMASGHSREKALEIARNASTAKRVRSEESAKETPGGKKPKTSSHVGRPIFSQVASIVRLGIVPSDLAKSPFNKEQLVLIQETVIDVMIEVDDNNKPVFESAIHRNGWLLFLCSNNDTAKWMRSNFDLIKKKCGLEMMLVEENDFPKTFIVRGFFPQSIELSNEKILATIGVQNNLAAKH
ncbi:uncharacterized protein LOC128870328 [Anastrepha ludens]|uniref:uncharacterized protein LOC128870328 n=1 Tax=Anastrepha ludens TaxID=28586 RepID=UPI0023B162A3|nr:uncharacterized protein LOC128870328 [Anastrepha ludens]